MRHIVDFHIHSHYSRATARGMNLDVLYRWAKIKGIGVLGTGDFTHPKWFAEMQDKLVAAEDGLYKLREDLAAAQDAGLPASVRDASVRFVPSVEISTIYSKGGRVRKLHNLIVMPSFEAVARLNTELARIGNLTADGRPILGLGTKELLRLTLAADRRALYIPAHIWTPWFALFGSKSGFNSIEEAFEELAPEVHAIETGLSSDPFMNWRVDELRARNITVTSNSDAHSPAKLGREANIVESALTYDDIVGAFKTNDARFVGTIEFFPEEGKYHLDGHRACGVRMTPAETRAVAGVCPKCGRPLTVGVMARVEELAGQPADFRPATYKTVEYIIPLAEMLAEIRGVKSTAGRAVQAEYERMIAALGSEFFILREASTDAIRAAGFVEAAVAIENMRAGRVRLDPGYDGVYGVIKALPEGTALKKARGQKALF